MSILDKFLDIMKLNDEDEYEDDIFDDDEEFDDYPDKKKGKKGFFSKSKKYDDDDDDFDDDDDYTGSSTSSTRANFTRNNSASKSGSKVTPMRQHGSQHGSQHGKKANMEVCVIKPTTVDDTREIADTLLEGSTIILNLEGLDLEIAQRIIDFTAGSTYTISGKLQKISNFIFLVTPTNVDISGDLQDLLNSSFDVSSMGRRF